MSSRNRRLQRWLLGLLLVPLTGLATACNQEEPSAMIEEATPSSTTAVEEPIADAPAPDLVTEDTTSDSTSVSEPIQDVVAIVDASDQPSLAGQKVDLQNANVESVIGDRVFWVGNASERVLVLLDQSLDAGAAEKNVDVDPGKTVDIVGTLMNMPTPEQAQQEWGLTPAETAPIENEVLYVKAEQINLR